MGKKLNAIISWKMIEHLEDIKIEYLDKIEKESKKKKKNREIKKKNNTNIKMVWFLSSYI